MPRKSAKSQRRSKIAQELRANKKIPDKPIVEDPFKMKKYPKSDLFIVLDLDQTLWHMKKPYHECRVKSRPYALNFVKFCLKISRKVIFITGAGREATLRKLADFGQLPPIPFLTYEDLVIKYMNPEPGLWINYEGEVVVKPVPDFDEKNTVIIDDIPEFYVHPYKKNVLKIKPYRGEEDDCALIELAGFLLKLSKKRQESIEESIKSFTNQNPHICLDFSRDCPFYLQEYTNRLESRSQWELIKFEFK